MENIQFDEIHKYGDHAAIKTPDSVLTYKQLADLCDRMKGMLRDRSLIFHIASNTIDAVSGYVAFLSGGQVQLLLGEDLSQSRLRELMSLYRPQYLYLPLARTEEYSKYKVVIYVGAYVLLETDYVVDYAMHDDLALLLTTSGSTGSRKCVRLSYRNIRANAESIAEYLELDGTERPALILPMHYTYGLSIINSHLLVGATLLLPDKKILQKEFWIFFEENRATSISGTPYVYEMLSKSGFASRKLPSLVTLTQAGGKLPEKLQKKFAGYAEERGIRFYVMYGQTEATARMAYLPWQRAAEKCGSIGRAIPGGRLSLVDGEGREIDEAWTEGEIVYYGENVSLGYAEGRYDLCRGDENQGRLCTGDLGMRDEEGFYYITGRKKRFIKMFGKRVSLDEIELQIKDKFPETDCCCGGKDDRLVIVTDEIRKEARDEIRLFTAAGLQVPTIAVVVKYRECLPRTESGKIRYDGISWDE